MSLDGTKFEPVIITFALFHAVCMGHHLRYFGTFIRKLMFEAHREIPVTVFGGACRGYFRTCSSEQCVFLLRVLKTLHKIKLN